MPSRRRSRNKSIAGNITDVQKRLRYLETRPAPSQLARKVVSTKNLALRAVEPDTVADAAIVRRTLAPQAVASANLSTVTDPDGAAVATENVQDTSITNEKLAGEIEDDKIVGISASKIGPDLLQDDQLEGIATDKLIGTVLADQLAGGITFDQIDSVDAATITEGLIQDEQIEGLSGEKIIGGVDGDLIVDGSIEAIKIAGVDVTVLIGNIQPEQIEPNSLTEDQLAENSVGYDELQANSVGTAQLIIGSVVDLIIDDLAIQRRHLNDDVIIARMINNGAVVTAGIGNLQVTTAKLDNSAVTNAKIADNTITSGKINSGSYGVIVNGGLSVGSGLTKSFVTGGPAAGDAFLSVNLGTGSTQAAAGNHTHSSSGVPSHTHPVSASISGTVGGTGTHSGHSIPSNGAHSHTVSISSTITTQAPSSLKLKKEISDHQPVDIKNILNLKLKKYKYKNQLRHLQDGINREWMHGYIAEEVQELGFEELLGYDEKGEPASLNYGLLSTLILELVKVQQTEIDYLKEEIQRLKEKI